MKIIKRENARKRKEQTVTQIMNTYKKIKTSLSEKVT